MSKPKQTRIPQTETPEDAEFQAAIEALEGAVEHAKSAAETKRAKADALMDLMEARQRPFVIVDGRKWFRKDRRAVASVKVPKHPRVSEIPPEREKLEAQHRKNTAARDFSEGRSKVAERAAAKASGLTPELLESGADLCEQVPEASALTLQRPDGRSVTFTKGSAARLRAAAKKLRQEGGRS